LRIQIWPKNKLSTTSGGRNNPTLPWRFVPSSNIGGDISEQNYLKDTISLIKIFKNYVTKQMEILGELISKPSNVLQTNALVAWSPLLTGGLRANKKLPQFGVGKFKSNIWYFYCIDHFGAVTINFVE
jgi:hypothetical protein